MGRIADHRNSDEPQRARTEAYPHPLFPPLPANGRISAASVISASCRPSRIASAMSGENTPALGAACERLLSRDSAIPDCRPDRAGLTQRRHPGRRLRRRWSDLPVWTVVKQPHLPMCAIAGNASGLRCRERYRRRRGDGSADQGSADCLTSDGLRIDASTSA